MASTPAAARRLGGSIRCAEALIASDARHAIHIRQEPTEVRKGQRRRSQPRWICPPQRAIVRHHRCERQPPTKSLEGLADVGVRGVAEGLAPPAALTCKTREGCVIRWRFPFSSISGSPRPSCLMPPPVLRELLDQCAANLAHAARWHPMGLAMGGTSTPDQRSGFPGRDEQTRLSTRSPRTRMRRVLLSLEASQHEPAADREHGEHGGHDRAFGGA